jgi:hypothetical protein
MLRYQEQNSRQTLAEGLVEYYAANEGRITPPPDLPPDSAALFRSHDICHVIFGLDTSLADEAMADARTLLSCNVPKSRYIGYLWTDEQTKAIFRALGWRRIVGVVVRTLPRIGRGIVEAFRMKKRWPWQPPESYRARSLVDLRREYGIRVI